MAKKGEDYDDLFKSLIPAFFHPYLQLFHPDLLTFLDADQAEWIDKELRFPDFGQPVSSSKNQKRFADLVAKIPYRDPAQSPHPRAKHFILAIEPEKGSVSDLRPRMAVYRLGLRMAHPEAHVVVAGLYLDTALKGIGVDWFVFGDLSSVPATSKGQAKPTSQAAKTENAEAFGWPYVGLPGLDAEAYIQKAKTNPLIPALVGFMRIKRERRVEILAAAIEAIDGYELEMQRKNLLARGLLAGLDLDEDERRRFEEMIQQRQELRRADSVIKTWYDQGEQAGIDKGRKEGLKEGILKTVLHLISRRFGSSATVEKAVSKMSESQLQDLAAALLDPSKTLEDLGLVKKRLNGTAKT